MPGSSRMTMSLTSSGDGLAVGVAPGVLVGWGVPVGVPVAPGCVGVALAPSEVGDAAAVAGEDACWSGCATAVDEGDGAGVTVVAAVDAEGVDDGIAGP